MRQSIRGYTDGTLELSDPSDIAPQVAAVRDLLASNDDLRHVLLDTGVPAVSRRTILSELLADRVSRQTLSLLNYMVDADRAPEFTSNVSWLAARTEAASRNAKSIGEPVLGRAAAEERLDGYAGAVLAPVPRGADLTGIEDELFRFAQIVSGSEELSGALTSRSVTPDARRSLVEELLRGKVSDTTVRLASYATQVGRPRDYQALLAYLVDRVAAESNRRLADVRAAVDMDEGQRRQLAAALSRVVGHEVEVRVTRDPSVLGGLVAVIGDTVVDGSARHRLEILKERLVMPEATITTGDRS